jgi:hypothetical protein
MPVMPWMTAKAMAATATYQDHDFMPKRPTPTAICRIAAKMPRKPDHIPALVMALMLSAPSKPLKAEVIPPTPKANKLHTNENAPIMRKYKAITVTPVVRSDMTNSSEKNNYPASRQSLPLNSSSQIKACQKLKSNHFRPHLCSNCWRILAEAPFHQTGVNLDSVPVRTTMLTIKKGAC